MSKKYHRPNRRRSKRRPQSDFAAPHVTEVGEEFKNSADDGTMVDERERRQSRHSVHVIRPAVESASARNPRYRRAISSGRSDISAADTTRTAMTATNLADVIVHGSTGFDFSLHDPVRSAGNRFFARCGDQPRHPQGIGRLHQKYSVPRPDVLKNNHLKDGILIHSLRVGYQAIQGNREVFVITGVAFNQNPVVIREVQITGKVFNDTGQGTGTTNDLGGQHDFAEDYPRHDVGRYSAFAKSQAAQKF